MLPLCLIGCRSFAIMFDSDVKVKLKTISLNGRWFVATEPASPEPGRDDDPAGRAGEPDVPEGWRELPPSREDWLTEDEWVERLSWIEPEEWADPDEDSNGDPGEDLVEDPGHPLHQATSRPRAAAEGGRL